jgi:hypothetical protein
MVTRPGTYYLDRLRIGYVADGHRGWQFFYVSIRLTGGSGPGIRDAIHCKTPRHGQP